MTRRQTPLLQTSSNCPALRSALCLRVASRFGRVVRVVAFLSERGQGSPVHAGIDLVPALGAVIFTGPPHTRE